MAETCLLVIPSFRDAARLRPFLLDLIATLGRDFSIRISDDGSGGTEQRDLVRLIEETRGCLRADGPVLMDPILAPRNGGKGAAVYAGWRAASEATVLAFADADGAVGAAEVLRLWHRLKTGAPGGVDALFASRILKLGRQVDRRATRHYAGRIFATCVSQFTGVRVYDSQCGLKFVRRDAFEVIDPFLQASRLAFDVELMLALVAGGFRIEEAAVDWRDVPGGSVSILRHAAPMLLEVAGIRDRLRRCGGEILARRKNG